MMSAESSNNSLHPVIQPVLQRKLEEVIQQDEQDRTATFLKANLIKRNMLRDHFVHVDFKV